MHAISTRLYIATTNQNIVVFFLVFAPLCSVILLILRTYYTHTQQSLVGGYIFIIMNWSILAGERRAKVVVVISSVW
jgi:hypothetical protein